MIIISYIVAQTQMHSLRALYADNARELGEHGTEHGVGACNDVLKN